MLSTYICAIVLTYTEPGKPLRALVFTISILMLIKMWKRRRKIDTTLGIISAQQEDVPRKKTKSRGNSRAHVALTRSGEPHYLQMLNCVCWCSILIGCGCSFMGKFSIYTWLHLLLRISLCVSIYCYESLRRSVLSISVKSFCPWFCICFIASFLFCRCH
jgi:hypothetical protein